MVNKAIIGLAAVVLLSVFGIGLLVGMQVGGGDIADSSATPDATESTETTASGPQTTATPSQSATTEQTETAPDEGQADIPPREFSESNISAYIVEYLNDGREEAGVEPLSTSGTTAADVQIMAQNHSETMASAEQVSHTIDGVTSADRYRDNGLYQTCEFNVDGNYIAEPSNDQFEAVGDTVAGQTYTVDGEEQFNGDDAAVARALVDHWLATSPYDTRLTVADASRVGVGVSITNRGTVYATVNICG